MPHWFNCRQIKTTTNNPAYEAERLMGSYGNVWTETDKLLPGSHSGSTARWPLLGWHPAEVTQFGHSPSNVPAAGLR